MLTRLIKPQRGPSLLVRPLRDGDVDTVRSIFDRLGDESRRMRFNGPKTCLSDLELAQLARIDADHHALVGYVDGDPLPVAIARLARDADGHAEIAFAVADEYQHCGIGSALAGELIADARAAGITEINALVRGDNPHALALIRRNARVTRVRQEGPELSVRAAIA